MHGLLSLWTKTTAFQLKRGAMLIATMSINYAARSFDRLEFVTDSDGLWIAKRLGWTSLIDSCHVELDNIAGNGTTHIWALGKLHAIGLQKSAFCHFDLDAFLRKPLPPRIQASPVIAQSLDFPKYYHSQDIHRALKIAGLNKGGVAYNAGIIGGADIELMRQFSSDAIEMAKKFARRPINGTSASMVIEQYHLGEFVIKKGTRIRTLLSMNPDQEEIERIGYTHLLGEAKSDPVYVTRVEKAMQDEFPEAYDRFQFGWSKLEQEFMVAA